MAVQYHTHTFEIPAATPEDVTEGTRTDVAVIPASLGRLSSLAGAGGSTGQVVALQPDNTFGLTDAGAGDMIAAEYDPDEVGGNAFDFANHSSSFSVTGPSLALPEVFRRRYVDVGTYCPLNDASDATAGILAAVADGMGREVVFSNPYGGRRTYLMSSAVSSALSDTTFIGGDGAVIDISALSGVSTSASPAIDVAGSLDSSINLTANVSKAATNLPLASVVGLAVGDWLFLSTNKIWWSTTVYSEWVKIKQVNVSSVDIFKGLRYAHTTADGAKVAKANFVQNIRARNLQFLGAGDGTTFQTGMRVHLGYNTSFDDCGSDGCGYLGVVFSQSLVGKLRGGNFRRATIPGFSYGIGVTAACMDITVDGASGDDLRHLTTIGGSAGINHDIKFLNLSGFNMRDAVVDAHPQCDLVIMDNITGHSSSDGVDIITMQASGGSISNIQVSGKSPRHGVLVQPAANEVGAISVSNVQGDATQNLVFCDYSKDAQGLSISDIRGAADARLVSIQASAGAKLRRWSVTRAISTKELPVRGLHFIATGVGSEITNGSVTGCNLEIRAGGSGGFEGAYFQGTSSGTISEVSVTGNTIKGGTTPLRGVNTDYMTTAGNVLRGGSSGTNRSLAGANNALGTDITA